MPTSIIAAVTSEVIIRRAEEKDLPAMEWDGEYSHFRNLFQSLYKSSIKGETILWLVELSGEGIVGQMFVQLTSARPELADGKSRAYLFSFRVKKRYRNNGIGAQLLEFVETDLRSRGFRWCVLNVDQKNLPARRFYEKFNYRVLAAEPGCWSYIDQFGKTQEIHEPAWRMEKQLI